MEYIIVTGDSRGLGAHIVETLLRDKDRGVIGISRSENDLTKRFEQNYTDRYEHINFDLSQPNQINELYKDTLKPRGEIYGLVNNAAIAYDDLVTNADLGSLSQMFNLNVFSPMMLSKYSIRDMILNRTEGSLVHISTVATATGYRGLSMYGATKGALESFSLSVAREWGERGIRSNCVAAGFMNTDMTSTLNETQKDRIYDRTGLGKPTDKGDVAETVSFLLSSSAQSTTGETIRVDSGTL